MKYRTVLLDADGTLIDFERCEREALFNALELSGVFPVDEHIRAYSQINDSLWKMLERGEIERSALLYRRFELFCELFGMKTNFEKMALDYMNALSDKGYMLNGAEDLLKNLYSKCDIYIVTNGIEPIQSQRLSNSVIPLYAKEIFISGAIGYEKPDVRYFDYVAEHINGFSKDSAVIVGDSLTSDIKGGIDFGIDTCWYNPKRKNAPADICATYIADSFEKITDIIFGGGNI